MLSFSSFSSVFPLLTHTCFFLIFHFSPFRLHLPLSHLVYLISPAILHTTASTYFFPSLCFLIFFSQLTQPCYFSLFHRSIYTFPLSHLSLSYLAGHHSLHIVCFSLFSLNLFRCVYFPFFFTFLFLCTCPPVSPGLCNISCHHPPQVEYQIITLCSSFSLFSKHTHSLYLPPPFFFLPFRLHFPPCLTCILSPPALPHLRTKQPAPTFTCITHWPSLFTITLSVSRRYNLPLPENLLPPITHQRGNGCEWE